MSSSFLNYFDKIVFKVYKNALHDFFDLPGLLLPGPDNKDGNTLFDNFFYIFISRGGSQKHLYCIISVSGQMLSAALASHSLLRRKLAPLSFLFKIILFPLMVNSPFYCSRQYE
jgi:hypothetical protein